MSSNKRKRKREQRHFLSNKRDPYGRPPLTGHRYNDLTLKEQVSPPDQRIRTYRCECKCGAEVTTTVGAIQAGYTPSCGGPDCTQPWKERKPVGRPKQKGQEAKKHSNRNVYHVTAHGLTLPLTDWLKLTAVQAGTVRARIQRGTSTEAALDLPEMPEAQLGQICDEATIERARHRAEVLGPDWHGTPKSLNRLQRLQLKRDLTDKQAYYLRQLGKRREDKERYRKKLAEFKKVCKTNGLDFNEMVRIAASCQLDLEMMPRFDKMRAPGT